MYMFARDPNQYARGLPRSANPDDLPNGSARQVLATVLTHVRTFQMQVQKPVLTMSVIPCCI